MASPILAALGLVLFVVVFVVVWIAVTRSALKGIATLEFEKMDEGRADPGALNVTTFLEGRGFRPLAVYQARDPDGAFTVTVLAAPEGEGWAEVTDRLWELSSPYGSRRLRTATHSMMPSPATTLVQCLPWAAPAEVLDEHRRALRLLVSRGVRADQLEDDDLLERFEGDTRSLLALFRRPTWLMTFEVPGRRLLGLHRGRVPLTADPDAQRRIEAWLRAGSPTELR